MNRKKIAACQIYSDELSAVLPDGYKDAEITWLDAGLHWNRGKLETTLMETLDDAQIEGTYAVFVFANGVHPDMRNLVSNRGGKIVGANHLVEVLCPESYEEIGKDQTMVIIPGWIRHFSRQMEEAGWDEVDIRQRFGRFNRFLLLDTGINPLPDEEILEFYDRTQVPIEIKEISLDHFKGEITQALQI